MQYSEISKPNDNEKRDDIDKEIKNATEGANSIIRDIIKDCSAISEKK